MAEEVQKYVKQIAVMKQHGAATEEACDELLSVVESDAVKIQHLVEKSKKYGRMWRRAVKDQERSRNDFGKEVMEFYSALQEKELLIDGKQQRVIGLEDQLDCLNQTLTELQGKIQKEDSSKDAAREEIMMVRAKLDWYDEQAAMKTEEHQRRIAGADKECRDLKDLLNESEKNVLKERSLRSRAEDKLVDSQQEVQLEKDSGMKASKDLEALNRCLTQETEAKKTIEEELVMLKENRESSKISQDRLQEDLVRVNAELDNKTFYFTNLLVESEKVHRELQEELTRSRDDVTALRHQQVLDEEERKKQDDLTNAKLDKLEQDVVRCKMSKALESMLRLQERNRIVKEKEKEIQSWKTVADLRKVECDELGAAHESQQAELSELSSEIEHCRVELINIETEQTATRNDALNGKNKLAAQLSDAETRLQEKTRECDSLQSELRRQDDELQKKEEELTELQKFLVAQNSASLRYHKELEDSRLELEQSQHDHDGSVVSECESRRTSVPPHRRRKHFSPMAYTIFPSAAASVSEAVTSDSSAALCLASDLPSETSSLPKPDSPVPIPAKFAPVPDSSLQSLRDVSSLTSCPPDPAYITPPAPIAQAVRASLEDCASSVASSAKISTQRRRRRGSRGTVSSVDSLDTHGSEKEKTSQDSTSRTRKGKRKLSDSEACDGDDESLHRYNLRKRK
eukprot:GHVQ01012702.1.p1 GENE.GHVQ01012702.1~~GHVQ01012702.1.p1  ORF type:complete len:687 (+),score=139.23 GHVQ01012702.1:118-2178(+)